MKKLVVLICLFCSVSGYAQTQKGKLPKPGVTVKAVPSEPFCYVLKNESQGVENALRFTRSGNNIKGELKYIVGNEKPMVGDLIGIIKGDVIQADWTYTKDGNYYKVPVEFKLTQTAAWQKPSAVDDKGVPYVPADADYMYEFPKVDCSAYPTAK